MQEEHRWTTFTPPAPARFRRFRGRFLHRRLYVPRAIADIFHHRIGDCKDVSRLVVAMVRRMGYTAHPALVDTYAGPSLKAVPPSIGAFNHCIARIEHEGKVYWFDATRPGQGGRLETAAQAWFGYALTLKADSDLEPMGDRRPELQYEVREFIRLPKAKAGLCHIEVEYIYRGEYADAVRHQLLDNGIADFTHGRAEVFGYIYALERTLIPEISDDFDQNVISIRLVLETKNPWFSTGKLGEMSFFSPESAFEPLLGGMLLMGRQYPLDLGPVRRVRTETLIQTDFKVKWPKKPKLWQFGGLKLSFDGEQTSQGYCGVREYIIETPELSPEDSQDMSLCYDDIMAYNRLRLTLQGMGDLSWWQGFFIRAGLWSLPLWAWLAFKVFGH